MKDSLVSVLICVYNGEDFLAKTIESVIAQTYKNLEIVIVDDASKDSSVEIIKKYAMLDSRIKPVYLSENLHLCNAGNEGFKQCKGEYIALIGHDDIWAPNKIEKQVEFMNTNLEYAVCFTWIDLINAQDEILEKTDLINVEFFNIKNRSQSEWATLFLHMDHLSAPSAFIRKTCLHGDNLYRYALVQAQDYELWTRLIKDYPIYVIEERLTKYRRYNHHGKENLSGSSIGAANRGQHEREYIIYNWIKEMNDETFTRLFSDIFQDTIIDNHYDILCLKAFLFRELELVHSIDYFIEILEDENVRNILKNKYSFTLQDFYELNKKGYEIDQELYNMYLELKKQYDLYKKYYELTELNKN